ncbi:MAG TPA: hypothetical protein VGM67_11645 [Gemmatimonadaceae bacterium]|jgi:hypothetical protein
MLLFVLAAQLAVSSGPRDSTYATPALREVIAHAAEANHIPPAALRGYQSHIESELALLVRDTLGRELTAQIEQIATTATWERSGRYNLHVEGYRSQSMGIPYSALNTVHAWTVPTLYGERLLLGAYPEGSRDSVVGVHPFAPDRDQYYRFSGGDTVAVLRAGAREIPVVRIRVVPDFHGDTRLAAFDGEIDLDAVRFQIIRMRGRFVVLGKPTTRERRMRWLGVIGVAYIEFVNAEVDGKYWLPATQRTEFQASLPLLGRTRPVFRLMSTFSHIAVDDTGPQLSDSLGRPRISVTWAPGDSVSAFDEWELPLGQQSASVHSDDFDDVAPLVWRADGPPRVDLFPNSMDRVLRFNRVEGLFTGFAPSVDFRSVAPGVTASLYGGWAWSEQTARGGGSVTYQRGDNTLGARAQRELVSTNDFTPTLGGDPGLNALLTSLDDFDYVDRRTALASLTHALGKIDVGLVTLQLGAGDDQPEHARLSQGLFRGSGFRPNRGASPGGYAIGMADFELHPGVRGEFVQPGIGVRAHYEAAAGTLSWQRLELGVSARRYVGPLTLTASADGGMLFGQTLPPQQLFELGGNESLPGYDYKQFAGDRAALFRSFISYRLPVLRRPFRVRRFLLPGLAPGFAVGAQGGWTEISSDRAQRAVDLLGAGWSATPVSVATGGARATVGGGLTLFSDVLHIGLARPVDHSAPWKLVAGFGLVF